MIKVKMEELISQSAEDDVKMGGGAVGAAEKEKPARANYGPEVHIGDDIDGEAFLKARHEEQAKNRKGLDKDNKMQPCAVCFTPTLKKVTSAYTTSFFCSVECQKAGWNSHRNRAKTEERRVKKWEKVESDCNVEDKKWATETEKALLTAGPEKVRLYGYGCGGEPGRRVTN